jgi:hypothetical protein
MTPEEIEQLGPAFAAYLQQFLVCCDYTQTFDLLGVYCRGLLSDLDRKTCEPIALAAGVAVRTLQEFLRDWRWSFAEVRDALQRHVAATLPARPGEGLGTVGLIDETATRKKGTKTPGVQRQHCGELGKLENCIVTVHLGVARGRYKTLCDADLFLPQSWDADRDRCREAGANRRRRTGAVANRFLPYRERPAQLVGCDDLDRREDQGISPGGSDTRVAEVGLLTSPSSRPLHARDQAKPHQAGQWLDRRCLRRRALRTSRREGIRPTGFLWSRISPAFPDGPVPFAPARCSGRLAGLNCLSQSQSGTSFALRASVLLEKDIARRLRLRTNRNRP